MIFCESECHTFDSIETALFKGIYNILSGLDKCEISFLAMLNRFVALDTTDHTILIHIRVMCQEHDQVACEVLNPKRFFFFGELRM